MNQERVKYLLGHLAEECCEIGKCVSKAIRFGLEEKWEKHEQNNAERLNAELVDLFTIISLLQKETAGKIHAPGKNTFRCSKKEKKIDKYLKYSVERGMFDASALKSS